MVDEWRLSFIFPPLEFLFPLESLFSCFYSSLQILLILSWFYIRTVWQVLWEQKTNAENHKRLFLNRKIKIICLQNTLTISVFNFSKCFARSTLDLMFSTSWARFLSFANWEIFFIFFDTSELSGLNCRAVWKAAKA